jgi:transposase-like protein
MKDGRWWCPACEHRVSATAGTIFHHTRTPLTVWFAVAWDMVAGKNGISAKTLHRKLEFGSYQTAWAMLHRYRCAISNGTHKKLSGAVEVDETFFGGVRHGKRGRGAEDKVLVVIAVERTSTTLLGRCRMQLIAKADAKTLEAFICDNIEPGSTIYTDGFKAYPSATAGAYKHVGVTIKGSGKDAHELLPGVHRIAALVKRWLMGTHQGSFEAEHLQAYLNEYTFRFNRRKSKHRGMLFFRLIELAVTMHQMPFYDLVANHRTKNTDHDVMTPSNLRKKAPSSLDNPVLYHPWRR